MRRGIARIRVDVVTAGAQGLACIGYKPVAETT
jgi:hypothetical protein